MINKKIFKSVAGFFVAVLSVTAINVYASDKAAEYQEAKAWCIAGEYPVTPESPLVCQAWNSKMGHIIH